MVKADIKRNYYTDLELPGDATVEDIKKQYRKLALKYHPDRNPGKEAEIVPKFQAIQAAHEVLQDPVTKSKYDADRRKAGLVPTFGRTPTSAARAPPNPYAASTGPWPPPPKRNATTGDPNRFRASAAGAGTSGADRFTNFPKPAPTSKRDDKANVFTAWQNINHAKKEAAAGQRDTPFQQPCSQPKGAFGTSPQKPRPAPPPRQDTRFPTEDDIRAGTNYRPAPAGGFQNPGARTAWADFNAQHAGMPGMPDLRRSNTTRTPKKSGFDPLAGGDEGQAASTANYSSYRSRTRSDDARAYPPPPPRYPEAPSPSPYVDPSAPSHADSGANDVPYTENIKVKTPYSSHIGQQRYTSSDNLHRSHSARDTTRGVRSTTPPPKQPSARPRTGSRTKPFVVEDSTDESTSDEGSSATTPENTQPNKTNPDLPDNPFLRPKRTPVPPSSRTASPLKQQSFESASSSAFSGSNRADVGDEQAFSTGRTGASNETQSHKPNDQGKNTMYESPLCHSSYPPPAFEKRNARSAASWSQFGIWAIPSTVLPPNYKASALQQDLSGSTSIPAVGVDQTASDSGPASTWDPAGLAALPQPSKSRKESRKKERLPSVHDNAQRVHADDTQGLHMKCSPPCSNPGDNVPGSAFTTGFTFPVDSNTFQPTALKDMRAKSTENINTKFTPSEWAGTFNANNNIFAAPPPVKKPSSPARKSSKIFRQPGSAQSSQTSASEAPFSQYSGLAPGIVPPGPPSPPQDPVKFNADQWAKTIKNPTWAFDPEALRSDPAIARPTSRGARKASTKGVRTSTTTPKPATATAVEDDDEHDNFRQADTASSPTRKQQPNIDNLDDVMDIDMEGVGPSGSATPVSMGPAGAQQKQPKFVQVDPSTLHGKASTRESTGPRLSDLAATLPGSGTGDGLTDLKDISSTLPFQSKPAARLPTKSYAPQTLPLPKLPVPPESPTRLTKSSWRDYCEKFARYHAKYLEFDGVLLEHFRARHQKAVELVSRGATELESIGAEKWLDYKRGIDEDERVRAHRDLGADKHNQAIKSFDSVREKVMKLSESTGLADV